MSIFEYDKEEEERKLREAEYEGGWQAGLQAGQEAGLRAGLQKGRQEMLQVVKEIYLEEDVMIELLCRNLGVDEAEARKMLNEE